MNEHKKNTIAMFHGQDVAETLIPGETISFAEILIEALDNGNKHAENANVNEIKIAGYDPFPICGNAWVWLKNYGCPFTKFCKKNYGDWDPSLNPNSPVFLTKNSGGKGYNLSLRNSDQSYDRNKARAEGVVETLKKYGIECAVYAYVD